MVRTSKGKTVYRIVRTREELEQGFSLVYKEYASRGYIPKHYKSKLKLSLYNALPSTTTFITKKDNQVIATVTLIPDSPMGLPMDKIYKKECDSLREKGRSIAEVSQLSIDSRLFPKGWFSMFNFSKLIFVFKLFKLVFDYACYTEKLDELCIAVNPKHRYLYKFLFFEKLAGLKYYGSVNKAPAIALHLDIGPALRKKSRQRKSFQKVFYGKRTARQTFQNKFIFKSSDLEHFFLKKSDLLKKATPEQLKYIKRYYPEAQVEALLKKYE